MPNDRLVLFDIDGTLLRAGRQVGGIFLEAMKAVYGTWGSAQGYDFGGKTDPQIVVDLLAAAGWDRDEARARLPEVKAHYLPVLSERLDGAQMETLPGARGWLDRFAEAEVAVGLVTGNWQGGAFTKLERLRLDSYFRFGAFGDDSEDRRALPPVALKRAEQAHGRSFRPEDTLIIGDTIHDIDCAVHSGMPVLAVATGRTPADRLEAAGANWVASDLESEAATEVLDQWLS